ncbi:MAG: hypothetical protein LLG13_07880 [Bacteroidales bacterium]|nr:hypothetical protein [Bacteroidales bacterium]
MNPVKNSYLFKIIMVVLALSIPLFLYGQKINEKLLPQFLYTDFNTSQVKMKSGQVFTSLMNYNTITEKMIFIKGDQYYSLTNPELVDTVYLNGKVFIPVGKVYYEILLEGPVSLFAQHKGELIAPGKPAAYGGTSQVSSSEYLSTVSLTGGEYNLPLPPDYTLEKTTVFWIRKESTWFDFATEKQFLKIFPGTSTRLKSFIKENRLKIDNPGHLKKLVDYCNSLDIK